MAIVIGADKSTRIARLFHVLWHGERIARDTAARQALICNDVKARRFFAMHQHAAMLRHSTARGAA